MESEPEADKLRLLINCAELEMLRNEYSFSISPDNLVCDINLMPKVIEREISDDYNDFCNEYKALVGSLLFSKYSFEDYYSGGKDLYKKKKLLKNISRQEDTAAIKKILIDEYDALMNDIKKNKALVSKKSRLAARIAVPVMAVFTAAAAAMGGWLFFIHTPYQKSLTAAANAYIAEDYIKVQNELSGISLTKIPADEKYILSRAYIITEALNAEQKENVLSGITLKTDERVLSYWIELGRLDFDGASDFSKQLGDDELLLF
ncbi:MAG: type VII secretion protein EssB/YukC, partial [Oscillospiraceae bacterium]